MREGGREGRGVSLTLWEVLEDSGDALGEQGNVAVSLGPHCATVGDIVNQVDLGREEGEREREGGKHCIVFFFGGGGGGGGNFCSFCG